ncbi:hypothetical protein LF1_59110 [Rubripirellula obstinata]|uniref:Uncharacterized protein n=1 Tax=Rubripirellula obstinata TaxID=406547 RepID=A0A5B1C9B0_9BACT|nr:hypothetical protein [Rubripirellula obstinata]KAA1256801.1 hypothetical protein LF1_59110 [Rubripirellula obstinata]
MPASLRGINQRPISNTQSMLTCRMHCVAPTNACLRLLDLPLLAETCLTNETLLRFETVIATTGTKYALTDRIALCVADNK